MILVTGCNLRYFDRIKSYLNTLQWYADFPYYLITVDFNANLTEGLPISQAQNYGAPPETECIQHGSFLQAIDTQPDEVIIYTDGDFRMQRPMDEEEREFLRLGDNQVAAGYNFGDHCTLEHDAQILDLKITTRQLINDWGILVKTAQDWNAGFLAMNRRTWERLYNAYMQDWERVCEVFAHQARQQWLISYEIAALGFEVKVCPWSIHAHGHGGLKAGMELRSDGVYADGKLALFRHYL